MTYSEKLKDPRWQKLRLQIFGRDNFTCKNCNGKSETLHVHHKHYIFGREPWEYDLENFETICSDCHDILSCVLKETKFILEENFINADILYELQQIITLLSDSKTPHLANEIKQILIQLKQENG